MASDTSNLDERRLWIGNLDTRLTEYQLLKIAQKCGNIEKFDMLFHKSGPQVGQPRGYAFVTYKTTKESAIALEKLNGKLIGSKHVVVRLAKNINYDELERPKPKIEIPVLAAGASKDRKISKEVAIQAIEAKLKMLENKSDDFEINKTSATEIPLIQKYQYNKMSGGGNTDPSSKQQTSSRYHYTKSRQSSRPYNKTQRHSRR